VDRRADRGLSVGPVRRAWEGELRQLVRDVAVPGSFGLAYAREPAFFAQERRLGARETHWGAREDGTLKALLSLQVRPAWVGGRPASLGWVHQWRFHPGLRQRLSVVRRGAALLRGRAQDGCDWVLAVGMDGQEGLAGHLLRSTGDLPRAAPRDRVDTHYLAPRAGKAPASGFLAGAAQVPAAEWWSGYRAHARAHQFSWRVPNPSGFPAWARPLTLRQGRRLMAGALWHPRPERQMLLRRMPPGLALLRPLFNLVAPRLGKPRVPAIGQELRSGYLSLLWHAPGAAGAALELMAGALALEPGLPLTASVTEGQALAGKVAPALGGWTLHSRLMLLTWAKPRRWPDGRPAQVDAGFL
jgi:hypothetical protein